MDILAGRILGSLGHIVRSIDQQNKRMCSEYNLTLPQLICIRQLLLGGSMTSSQLSNQMFITQATLTGVLDRLEAKGVLARTRSSQDRRKVFIALTEKGEDMARGMPWPLQEQFAHSLEQLAPEEQEQISSCLEKLVHLVDAPGPGDVWPFGCREELAKDVKQDSESAE